LSSINFTASAQTSGAISPKAADALAAKFGSLPLRFEANQGQSDPRVKFLSHGNGYSLFLTDSAAVLVLSKPGTSCSSQPAGKSLLPVVKSGNNPRIAGPA
jgi:hypothetical protein